MTLSARTGFNSAVADLYPLYVTPVDSNLGARVPMRLRCSGAVSALSSRGSNRMSTGHPAQLKRAILGQGQAGVSDAYWSLAPGPRSYRGRWQLTDVRAISGSVVGECGNQARDAGGQLLARLAVFVALAVGAGRLTVATRALGRERRSLTGFLPPVAPALVPLVVDRAVVSLGRGVGGVGETV
jgi:hypothetical protein